MPISDGLSILLYKDLYRELFHKIVNSEISELTDLRNGCQYYLMSDRVDHLDEDPDITGQKYCCFSFCSPEGVANCKVRGIICRGAQATYDDAMTRVRAISEKDKTFNVHVGEIGKWLAYNPERETKKSVSVEELKKDTEILNTLIGKKKKAIDDSKVFHDQRKKQLILQGVDMEEQNAADAVEEPAADVVEEPTAEPVAKPQEHSDEDELVGIDNVVCDDKETETKNDDKQYNKIDNLSEDPPVPGQKFVLYSFCSPVGVMNCNVWGIKIRGVYDSEDAANKANERLSKLDKYFDICVGEVGRWYPYDGEGESENMTEVKYRDEKLDKIIAKQRETKMESLKDLISKKKDSVKTQQDNAAAAAANLPPGKLRALQAMERMRKKREKQLAEKERIDKLREEIDKEKEEVNKLNKEIDDNKTQASTLESNIEKIKKYIDKSKTK